MKLLLAFLLFSVNCLVAQNLLDNPTISQAKGKLQLIKAGEMEFEVRNKRFSRTDTMSYTVHQLFSMPNAKEERTGQYNFLLHFGRSTYSYNGEVFIKEVGGQVYSGPGDWNAIYFDINLHSFIVPSFNQFINRILVHLYNQNSTLVEKDTIINNESLKFISISIPYPFPSDSFTLKYKADIYFSKENNLPERFSSTTSHASWGDFYTEMTLVKHKFYTERKAFIDELIEDRIRIGKQILDKNANQPNLTEPMANVLKPGDDVPGMRLMDFKNSETEVEKNGKVVLLYFWYRMCHPCLLSMPYLNNMQRDFGNKGLQIIAINVTDSYDEAMVKHFEVYGPVYTQATADKRILQTFNVSAFPTFYLIKDGKIIENGVGFSKEFMLKLSNH